MIHSFRGLEDGRNLSNLLRWFQVGSKRALPVLAAYVHQGGLGAMPKFLRFLARRFGRSSILKVRLGKRLSLCHRVGSIPDSTARHQFCLSKRCPLFFASAATSREWGRLGCATWWRWSSPRALGRSPHFSISNLKSPSLTLNEMEILLIEAAARHMG